MTDEVVYGRTPIGQLVYDLIFTKLSDKYLARKHKLPIADIRRYRKSGLEAFKKARRKSRKNKRKRK